MGVGALLAFGLNQKESERVRTSQKCGLADMEPQFLALLEQCAEHINAAYDVGGLCKAFPKRLREVIAAQGERFSH